MDGFAVGTTICHNGIISYGKFLGIQLRGVNSAEDQNSAFVIDKSSYC